MKAGWRDAPLTPRDLAEAIYMILTMRSGPPTHAAAMGDPWPPRPCTDYPHTNSDSGSPPPPPPSPHPGTKSALHINPSVSNQFPQSQPFSVRAESPQKRFSDHHKQDF